MGRYLSILILGMAAALSTSIVPQMIGFGVAILGNVTPILDHTRGQLNLVMLLVLAWSIRSDLTGGFIWAFVGGILIDLFSIFPLGTTSAALSVIVYMVNGVTRQLYRVRIFTILAMTLMATIFFYTYTYFALLLGGHTYDIIMQIRLVLIPTILYNLVAVLPVYVLVRLMQRRLQANMQGTASGLSHESEVST